MPKAESTNHLNTLDQPLAGDSSGVPEQSLLKDAILLVGWPWLEACIGGAWLCPLESFHANQCPLTHNMGACEPGPPVPQRYQNNHGSVQPLIPVADVEQLDDGDDDLGYYPDGTKRTLTDKQVEIFRHSEIQKLQREKRRKEMADREQAEVEALTDTSKEPLAGAGRSEAKGGGQGSSEYQQQSFEGTEKSYHDVDRKSTEDNKIRDGNGGAKKLLAYADEGTTFGHSQKPASSSGTNPFGRRLVSYDD
ncbi:hypothetical protein RJZ90_006524 [Blastomyces dermatitidis]